MRAMAECMRAEGWNATAHDRGITIPDVSVDQRDEISASRARCHEQLGIDDLPTAADLTDEQVIDQYEALVETKACLEGLGYDIPEPPSPEAFLDQWRSETGPWHPYESLGLLGPTEFAAVEEACPQP